MSNPAITPELFRKGIRGSFPGDLGIEVVRIVEENLDECVLCGLCLDASPPGAVRVIKVYDGGTELERAA